MLIPLVIVILLAAKLAYDSYKSLENLKSLDKVVVLSTKIGALAEGVQAQTHQALKNLQAVLQEAGLTLDNVVKTTVFVQDLGDFGTVNEIYGTYFHGGFPARSCVAAMMTPSAAPP
jgi:2-iminobutanoate/2-iminopropanoate deaminase